MTNIIPFSFEGHALSALNRNGEAWFIGNEVAAALGYTDPKGAIQKHCKAAEICKGAELALLRISCNSPRGMTIIPERDLYRLVMRSRLPSAEAFEEKVVGEILPTIRKTGSYNTFRVPQTYTEALRLAAEQAEELEVTRPKAIAYDELANTEGVFNLRESAKLCGWPERRFIRKLLEIRWLYVHGATGRKMAYASAVQVGYIEVKEVPIFHNTTGRELVGQPMITQKGLARLSAILGTFQKAA